MKVLIVGCGQIGASVATILNDKGYDVRILDNNPESFRLLPGRIRDKIAFNGDATKVDVLLAAGINESQIFVAVVSEDTRNAMIAQMAKHLFGVPRVLCRIGDPERQGMYLKMGLETLSPTRLISDLIINTIVS